MSRGLSSNIKTQLASSSFVMGHLVKLEFNNTYQYTDFSSDIDDGTITTVRTDVSINDTEILTFTSSTTDDLVVGSQVTGTGIPANTTIVAIVSSTEVRINVAMESNLGEGNTVTFVSPAVIYSANGFLQGMASVSESTQLTIGSLDLSLSGVNQTLISDLLNNGHIHRKVSIKRAFLNADTLALIESFSIYTGRVEGMDIIDSDTDSQINLSIANHWADFARLSGRRTNSGSQNQFFPNDKGFDFITQSNLT